MKIDVCPRCSGSGKVDWIDFARGVNRKYNVLHSTLLTIMKQTGSYDENPDLVKNIERHGSVTYPETDIDCPACGGCGSEITLTEKDDEYINLILKEIKERRKQ